MYKSQDRYVNVGQIKTRYWMEGDGETPILLVHGLGGFIENWHPCFSLLTDKHRVYAVDLLGHGRTDKPLSASYTVADLAEFVKGFMTALNIDRANLVGHSLGGAVVLQFALKFSDMVEKLTIVESAGLGKEGAFALRLLSLPLVGEMLSRPSRSGTAKMLETFVYDPTLVTDEEIDLHYQMGTQPGGQQTFLKTLRAIANLFGQKKMVYGSITSRLSSINNPTLIIWGQQDPVIPVAHAEIAAQKISDAQVELIDNCGHNPMLEQTEVFTKLLLEFLKD